MNVLTVVGAPPQFIKAGPVGRAFSSLEVREQLGYIGRRYDINTSDTYLAAQGMRETDCRLGIGSGGNGEQIGKRLETIEDILISAEPNALLAVYEYPSSTLAGALAAFCPSHTAVDHLAAEGVEQGVHMVGDVMKDALDYCRTNSEQESGILQQLELAPQDYFLATVHRAENVDSPERLDAILDAFGEVDLPVVLPLHPWTHHALRRRNQATPENVRVINPVGYLEMLVLESHARALLTDSGGVQKEAYVLGVPCITLRDETEWVETVSTGCNVLAGASTRAIIDAAGNIDTGKLRPELYGDGHASERVAAIVEALVLKEMVDHAV